MIDDLSQPRLGRVYALSTLQQSETDGFRLISLSAEPTTDQPTNTMRDQFPFLARLAALERETADPEKRRAYRASARLFVISAYLAAPRSDGLCHGKETVPPPSGPGWIEVPFQAECTGANIRWIPALVSSSLSRIDVALDGSASKGADLVFVDAAARDNIGYQPRTNHPEFDDYDWTPQICVDGQCFQAKFGSGYGYFEAYNSASKQYISVQTTPAWARDLTE